MFYISLFSESIHASNPRPLSSFTPDLVGKRPRKLCCILSEQLYLRERSSGSSTSNVASQPLLELSAFSALYVLDLDRILASPAIDEFVLGGSATAMVGRWLACGANGDTNGLLAKRTSI